MLLFLLLVWVAFVHCLAAGEPYYYNGRNVTMSYSFNVTYTRITTVSQALAWNSMCQTSPAQLVNFTLSGYNYSSSTSRKRDASGVDFSKCSSQSSCDTFSYCDNSGMDSIAGFCPGTVHHVVDSGCIQNLYLQQEANLKCVTQQTLAASASMTQNAVNSAIDAVKSANAQQIQDLANANHQEMADLKFALTSDMSLQEQATSRLILESNFAMSNTITKQVNTVTAATQKLHNAVTYATFATRGTLISLLQVAKI